jgi:PAS domain S-box-containing protein
MTWKPFIRLLLLIACLAGAVQLSFPAYGAEPIKIGVLAFPSKAQAQARWQPLAGVLKQAMPERDFVVITFNHPELDQAVAARQLDFVLTNGGQYVLLRNSNGLSSPLATLAANGTGKSLTVYGGVIFSRAGQADLNTLSDIKGKTVAAVASESQGAYQMQAYELSRVGIRLPQDVNLITTGLPQGQIVEAVLAGRADVGFVRSGVLEAMMRAGKLDITQLKILNPQALPDFPLLVSTRLYPEWPFAAMPHIDENLARHVAAVLFELDENQDAAHAMGIHGFVVPADYSPVEEVLRELRLPPFEVAPPFTLHDVWTRYRLQTIGSLLAGGLIFLLGVSVLFMYRRLAAKRLLLLQQQQKLQEFEGFRSRIFDSSVLPIVVMDSVTFQFVDCNPAAVHIYRLPSREDVIGKTPMDVSAPAQYDGSPSSEKARFYIEKSMAEEVVVFEWRHRRPNGEFWDAEVQLMRFYVGRHQFLQFSLQDITQRKQAEEALAKANALLEEELAERKAAEQELQAANEQLSLLLDSLPIAVYRCRAEGDFTVMYMSHNVVAFTGYESRDFMEQSDLWLTHIHPDDASGLELELAVLFEKGMNSYEYRWLAADGGYRWIEDSLRLFRSEDGTPDYMVGMWQDITARKQVEEAQRKASDELSLFRKLLDNSRDAIEVFDPLTLRYLDVNETACRQLGYSREELLAMSIGDIDPNLGAESFRTLEEQLQKSGSARFETTHRCKDGSIFPVEVSMGSVVLDKPYGLSIVRDISERRQAAEALRQSEEKFRALVESTSDWIWEVDLDGHYTYVSPRVEVLLGYKPEEVLGKSAFDFMPPDEVQRVGKIFGEAMVKHAPLVSLENTNLHKDGRIVVLESSGVPFFDSNGDFAGYRGIDRDITERQQTAQALADSERRFKAILDATMDGILVADAQSHVFVMGNNTICDMLGYEMDELTRLGVADIHPAAALPEVQRQFDRQMKGEILVAPNLPVQRKDGSIFFADVSSAPMVLAGRPLLVGVFHDVTERKEVEEKIRGLNEELEEKVRERTRQLLDAQEELVRKEKLALLGQIAGSVGHELRNPLGVMNNAVYFLQLVLADADETTREYLQIIKDQIADSERIVSDLLDSVRTKPPQPEMAGIGELINQILRQYLMPAAIAVTLDIPETLPSVWVDPMQIQQVFRNLISNGVEAMPEGGTLAISALENRQEGMVSVRVSDSGSGIAPEVVARLFQPLFTTKARGIGLGLVVCRNLTEANGGKIEVASKPGTGTVFTVWLPVAGEEMTSNRNKLTGRNGQSEEQLI